MKEKKTVFFPILYWIWKHAKTIPIISAKKSVLRLIRQVYKKYIKFTIMLWDVSENVLLSYKKISTLIPKIMNYKFRVGVDGEGLLTSLPYFTTLIPKIMNSKIRRGWERATSSFNISQKFTYITVYNFYTLLFLSYHEKCS